MMINIIDFNYPLKYERAELFDLQYIKNLNDIIFIDIPNINISIINKSDIIDNQFGVIKKMIINKNRFNRNLIFDDKSNVLGVILSSYCGYNYIDFIIYSFSDRFVSIFKNILLKYKFKFKLEKIRYRHFKLKLWKTDLKTISDFIIYHFDYQFVINRKNKNIDELINNLSLINLDFDMLCKYFSNITSMPDYTKINFIYNFDYHYFNTNKNIIEIEYYHNIKKFYFYSFGANIDTIEDNDIGEEIIVKNQNINLSNTLIIGLDIFFGLLNLMNNSELIKNQGVINYDITQIVNIQNVHNLYIYTYIPVFSLYYKLRLFYFLSRFYDFDYQLFKLITQNNNIKLDYLGIPLIIKLS